MRFMRRFNPRHAFADIVHGGTVAGDFGGPLQAEDRVFGQNVFPEKASALTGPAHAGTNNFRLKRLDK